MNNLHSHLLTLDVILSHQTALFIAVKCSNVEITNFLLSNGANPNIICSSTVQVRDLFLLMSLCLNQLNIICSSVVQVRDLFLFMSLCLSQPKHHLPQHCSGERPFYFMSLCLNQPKHHLPQHCSGERPFYFMSLCLNQNSACKLDSC
jgi:hypothetical protein